MEKKSYKYNGQTYESLVKLSEATDINRKTLKRLIEENPDKTIDDIVLRYKNEKTIYTYKGITYRTMEEAAQSLNLTKGTIAKYLKLSKNNLEEAMQMYEDQHTFAIIDGKRYRTQAELAEYLGITVTTLAKYIEKEGNIENAVKRLKKQEQESENYTWQGKTYKSLNSLSQAMDIPRPTLRRYLKETNGNADEAYIQYQERNHGKYEGYTYKGKTYSSLRKALQELGISTRQYIKRRTEFENNFEETIDAILEEKERKQKSREEEPQKNNIKTYIYNGKKMRISEIVKETNISEQILRRLLNEYEGENAEEVIQDYLDSKIVYNYNGKQFDSIKALAEETGIRELRLGRYIRRYDRDANKAVFMIKIQDLKKQVINYSGKNITYSDLAIILGIREGELVNYLINGGQITNLISNLTSKNQNTRRGRILPQKLEYNENSLYQYCIDNGINYSCIHYRITMGASVEEALEDYKKNGQKIPSKWIFEKYNVLLKHLLLNEKIDSKRVVSIMRNKMIPLQEAIEEYIIKDEAKKSGLNSSWQMELYDILASENIPEEEKEQFRKEFYVSDSEENSINKSKERINTAKRKILLYEIAECMNKKIFPENEMIDLLKVYEISEEEIETIFLDLYVDFYGGTKLADGQEILQKKKILNNYIKEYDSMSEEEKSELSAQIPEDIDFVKEISAQIAFYKNAIKVKQLTGNDIGKIGSQVNTLQRKEGEKIVDSMTELQEIERS